MKKLLVLALTSLFIFSCGSDPDIPDNSLDCNQYFMSIPWSSFCSLDLSNFSTSGPVDLCSANHNSTYPFDEFIDVFVANAFTTEGARSDFDDEEAFWASNPDVMEVSGLGDDAFAVIQFSTGNFDGAYIFILEDTFTIQIDMNANGANMANNCFDENTVFDFARAFVDAL